jgi:hypothetical protein
MTPWITVADRLAVIPRRRMLNRPTSTRAGAEQTRTGVVAMDGEQASDPVITDQQLATMSAMQRRELVDRLIGLGVTAPVLPRGPYWRRVLTAAVVGSLVMIPWIAVLAVTLPRHYLASHWTLAWVGFDLGLMAALATTAWMTWRGRPFAVIPASITATLLACDAWFDTTTAGRSDVLVSLLFAVAVELPVALLLLIAVRLVLRGLVVSVPAWAASRSGGA